MNKTLTEVIESLNLNAFIKLCEAFNKGINKNKKEIIVARYGDKELIKLIKKKEWNTIAKIYNSIQFGTLITVGNIFNKIRGIK